MRDDFRHETYEELLDPEVIGAARHRHLASTAVRRFDDVPTQDGATFEEDVAWELKCIRKARGRQVVVVDLTKPEFALPVVRVIVPGLEPILVSDYVPGRRAQGVIGRKTVSVYIFTGPTISAAEARSELEAVYLPPAAEGDVYRVTLQRPQAIGIIDGYFQSLPTVRHKEILWAMSRGVHVFGSASIGALRAAELGTLGMVGVGIIFKQYRDEVLEDDDEVAIAHGPAEIGFQAASEAMVNIRMTLQKAELLNVISTELRVALEKIGKELFYPDRNYSLLLRCASESGLPETHLARLRQWLTKNRVNQKKQDAIAMLRLMRRQLARGLKPKRVSFCFQYTATWESVWRQSGELRFDANAQPKAIVLNSLLEELRLESDQYKRHAQKALERFFVTREAERLGMSVSPERRRKAEIAFRRERKLLDDAELKCWMNDNNLEDHEFEALMNDEARVKLGSPARSGYLD